MIINFPTTHYTFGALNKDVDCPPHLLSTLSNICDENKFFEKITNGFSLLTKFAKKLHLRYLKESSAPLFYQKKLHCRCSSRLWLCLCISFYRSFSQQKSKLSLIVTNNIVQNGKIYGSRNPLHGSLWIAGTKYKNILLSKYEKYSNEHQKSISVNKWIRTSNIH